ncbi:MAG: hypothetical protein AAB902_02140 [Patescibacteria group bacterium]
MIKKILFFFIIIIFLTILFFNTSGFFSDSIQYKKGDQIAKGEKLIIPPLPPLDTMAYDKKLNELANNPAPKISKAIVDDPPANPKPTTSPPPKLNFWPVKTVYPNPGAILPFNRIVAYYGNLYSTKMGVLGEYPEAEMLAKLNAEVEKWNAADPATPVIPALHYIAVVAQNSSGNDGKHRFRMPNSEIDKILAMAAKINAIVFLDIQVGFSKVETEIPLLEKYLKMPQVHLAIDPEFSMKGSLRPGKVVGTLDAADINFTSDYLANLVQENSLTPKILIIHRYTQKMVTNYKKIKILPEVEVVMNMDGWGVEAKKINTYQQFIYKEPVQFTGFKLFYKNDTLNPGSVIMTPSSLLKLNPRPIYIQYQ